MDRLEALIERLEAVRPGDAITVTPEDIELLSMHQLVFGYPASKGVEKVPSREVPEARIEQRLLRLENALIAIDAERQRRGHSNDGGRGGLIAPPGECDYCDRRRAANLAAQKRFREKRDG